MTAVAEVRARPPAGGRRSGWVHARRLLLGRQPVGIAMIAPYLGFLGLVFAYPFVYAVWISFHDFYFTAPGVSVPKPWVGLANYRAVLEDPQVRQSFVNIVIFLAINVPLTTVIALVLASALKAVPWQSFFRTAYYLPYVTSGVAVIGVWLWLFSATGLVNRALGPLAPDPSWLINETFAMPLIALFVTWKQLGFFVLIYLAALQNVSRDLIEAATVDGAGPIRRWWSVTVPAVRPATALVVILATIIGANLFAEPYLLTGGGGPDGKSTSPVLIMYQRGIEQGAPDFAAALGVVLVIAVLAISLVNRRIFERG